MNSFCIPSVSTECSLDLPLSNDAITLTSWHKLPKMELGVARRNFTNPLPKLDRYDAVLVVLDTEKSCPSYKYPITRPNYKSKTSYTDLSNVSLSISLKHVSSTDLVLDDSVELKQEYRKVIMKPDGLFNRPNRIIKFLENFVEKSRATDSHEIFQNNSSLIMSQCASEGKGELEESTMSLPISVKQNNAHCEVLHPITVQYTVDDSSEPKRLKLSSDANDNNINYSSTLPSNWANFSTDENILVLSNFKENLAKTTQKEDNADYTDHLGLNEKSVYTQDFKFNIDVCIDNELSLNDDSSILAGNNSVSTPSQNETSSFMREIDMVENKMEKNEENVNPQVFTFNFQNLTADPPISVESLVVRGSATTQSASVSVTSTCEIEIENKNGNNEESVVAQDIKLTNDPSFDADSPISLVIDSSVKSSVSAQSQNEITTSKVEILEDKNDFVIFHSLVDTVNAPDVSSDYFLNDEYFEKKKPEKSESGSGPSTVSGKNKGTKRRQASENFNRPKRTRIESRYEMALSKKNDRPKNHLNWELYNFSKPEDCFEAVQNQWGGTFLPNPHDDLTCRFYNNLNPHPHKTNTTDNIVNNIDCLSVYESQINEINKEMNKIKYNLDNSGSLMDRRIMNKNLERWRKLKTMMGRLYDACDDARRFYNYYKDKHTGWNACYISEYHNNEIMRQFDILDAYSEFYGFS